MQNRYAEPRCHHFFLLFRKYMIFETDVAQHLALQGDKNNE